MLPADHIVCAVGYLIAGFTLTPWIALPVSVALLSLATLTGWLLGGPVGVGTLICAFATGPIMQLAFRTVRFDATSVRHQRLSDSIRVFAARK